MKALASGRPPLASYLRDNPHAFTRAHLVGMWSRHQLDTALSAGTVVRLLPDVYTAAAHVRHPIAMGEALNLWAPRGLVTGALALHLYSSDLRSPARADVVVPKGDRMDAPPWVRVHQVGAPRSSSAPRGIACTVPERALLDSWRFAAPGHRRDLLYEALWAQVCSWRQLRRESENASRVEGRRELRDMLRWFEAGATSPLEVRAHHETFADARFREFEWQVDLKLGSRRARADMLHRRAMLVVELDGARYHATDTAARSDRARDTDLLAEGYVTVRFGWDDIVRRPEWCRERLLAILATRLLRPGRS